MTYDYFCTACEKNFEISHSIKDKPKKICPSCKKSRLKRLISKTSFILRGTGWYKDGYDNKEGSR